MELQSANAVLLVRPAAFGFNAEAAQSNAFARASGDPELERKVMGEFEALARRLSDAGVEVVVLEDTPDPPKPDAVFPNNWVTFHADGTMALYPMAAASRRLERRPEKVAALLRSRGFDIDRVIDLSDHETEDRFLEGTGSLVLDRARRRAFASLSPRTDAGVIAAFDTQLGYSTFVFDARDRNGRPIYHTNVLLSFGTRFAVLCEEAVAPEDRRALADAIEASGRALIHLSFDQLASFGCNLLELRNAKGEPVIALSAAARAALQPDQVRLLETLGGELIDVAVPTIEAVGGGSVRCMIAEIHLPRS